MNELLLILYLLWVCVLGALFTQLGRPGLYVFATLCSWVANLFVLKQIMLFGCLCTCADPLILGIFFSLNILQEHYGESAVNQCMLLMFSSLLAISSFSVFHLALLPGYADNTQEAYLQLLSPTPRLFLAGLISLYCSQRVASILFTWLKTKTALSFHKRNFLVLSASQIVDTWLFTLLGLYGLVEKPVQVFFVSLLLKWVFVFILSSIQSLFYKKNYDLSI